ncbi:hypothetical protein BDW59DRAFT_159652 [Aspergillus cavernicola]|uniref:beta-glucosidase n=1 Tax=Aspergillus cavernicola TaxID=176166 RepID=A0ABR4IL47_9EURO
MTTNFRPTETGSHYLSISGTGPTKFFINDKLVVEQKGNIQDAMAFIISGQDKLQFRVYLDYPSPGIRHNGSWKAQIERQCLPPPYDSRSQDKLVAAVAAANPDAIVINSTGSPVELPWLDDIAGFVQAWYAGQETGNAIVDVLVSWEPQITKEVECAEGVFVGYRHFDQYWNTERQVNFPFGFGVNYTTFQIGRCSVVCTIGLGDDDIAVVTVSVKSTGDYAERPVKSLARFAKVKLGPREKEKVIEIEIEKGAAAYWNETANKWTVAAGNYGVLATSSQPKDVKNKLALEIAQAFSFDASYR